MVNQVILIGRVGQDIVLRHTPAGIAVAEVSLATDKGFGEKKKTSWHRISVWRESAENLAKIVHKGDTLYIEGSLDYSEYEKNGVKQYKTTIVANEWRHLVSRGNAQLRQTQFAGAPEEDDVL